jgi:hypothetical protein
MCMVKFYLPCKNVDKCKILMVYTLFSGGEKSSDNADEISTYNLQCLVKVKTMTKLNSFKVFVLVLPLQF